MIKKLFALILLPFFLIGCQSAEEEEFVFPEATFSMSSEVVKVNEPITFEVKITAGEKEVDDAKVSFEYWMNEKADEEHTTIEATSQSGGVYSAETTISEPGTYYVYYHADAMDMHLMEKYEFTVTQ
ncbi:FixH family protein [Calidifontibacillus erzurumensis]|uniref:FixH family protein n=1 Tax=Calidifontibacillus erzurumensis TaxID=2741433 RepID=A0A8J8GHT4_9BACI|nr:FixH family protein [Calidifontibacillus erzurumensis]NSL52021.1 FixH family protein [Calidifontibacillus erzurumensis]